MPDRPDTQTIRELGDRWLRHGGRWVREMDGYETYRHFPDECDRCVFDAALDRLEADLARKDEALQEADRFLLRLSHWDMLFVPQGSDTPSGALVADAPYWKREIELARAALTEGAAEDTTASSEEETWCARCDKPVGLVCPNCGAGPEHIAILPAEDTTALTCRCPAGSYDYPNAVHEDYCPVSAVGSPAPPPPVELEPSIERGWPWRQKDTGAPEEQP